MLTPKDLAEMKFDKVMFGGYDMGAVDGFLNDIENDFSALYKENMSLKQKLGNLMLEVDEYRGMDDSMRKAFSNSQAMANQIIEKANNEAIEIKSEASKKANAVVEQASSDAQGIISAANKDAEDITYRSEHESRKLIEKARAEADSLLADARAVSQAAAEAAVPVEQEPAAPVAVGPDPAELERLEAEKARSEEQLASYAVRIAAEEMKLEEAKTRVQMFLDRVLSMYGKASDELRSLYDTDLDTDVAPRSAPEKQPADKPEPEPEPEPAVKVQPVQPVQPAPQPVRTAVRPVVPPVTEKLSNIPEPSETVKKSTDRTAVQPDRTPAQRPVHRRPAADVPVSSDTTAERPAAKPAKSTVIPDTVPLPAIPPRRTAAVPARETKTAVPRSETYPNAVKRGGRDDDPESGDTVILTPKPRFDFEDLQFGDKYTKE